MQKAEARRKKEAEAHAAKQHNEAESTQKADIRRKKGVIGQEATSIVGNFIATEDVLNMATFSVY